MSESTLQEQARSQAEAHRKNFQVGPARTIENLCDRIDALEAENEKLREACEGALAALKFDHSLYAEAVKEIIGGALGHDADGLPLATDTEKPE